MIMKISRILKPIIVGAVGGISLYLGGHPFYLWPLLLVAGASIAFAGLSIKTIWEILLFSFVFVIIGFIGLIVISWSVVISIVVVVGLTLLYSLGVWIAQKQFRKGRVFFGTLAIGSFIASIEYLVSLSNIGTATSTAYSLLDFLPLVQISEYTGIWGITFLVFFSGAALGVAVYFNRHFKKYAFTFLSALIIVLAVIVWGALRLKKFNEFGSYIRTATVCVKEKQGKVIDKPAEFSLTWAENYQKLVSKAAMDYSSMLVVWPEEALKVDDATRDTIKSYLSNLSRQYGVYQVVGVYDESRNLNLAWVISPGGEFIMEYHKHHLVPFVDKADPGREDLDVVQVTSFNLGVVICNDEVFTDLTRKLGKKGAQVIADPSWDWEEVYERHARIVPMRAVENRVSIARSTKDGIAQMIDPAGRVLASLNTLSDSPDSDGKLLVYDLPVGYGGTFYSKYGDIFAFIAIAISIIAVVI
jgi:apolipoprotein N-acyltransferase